ncbi:hypothetical protein JTE90_021681 [Oedothorax gibbosus]|uniref:Uncharacterized protein n=1 Tax=Oedothorax gibbosus TaxID=931172 RepID=A0AAV6TFG2_9ARAC|nr:hypothetical protein JTE90_021681 [Oedothorax gibbosus]
MKEMAKGDYGRVNFPERLDHMRLLRPDLVEKKEQYVFAHRAVRDALTSKETEAYLVKVSKAYQHAEKLVFEGAVLAASDAAPDEHGRSLPLTLRRKADMDQSAKIFKTFLM